MPACPPSRRRRSSPRASSTSQSRPLARHVRAKGLRSESEVTRLLKARVFPAWKDRPFLSIRRSDVAALLDRVEDEHGAKQADYVLSAVRGIMNWFATRHD